MFNGKKVRGIGLPLPPSLKFTQIRNEGETKKLKKSVDKYQKELERRIRDLSTHQSKLLSSRRRDFRGGSLPTASLTSTKKEVRKANGNSSAVVSNSASDRHSMLSVAGTSAKLTGNDKTAATKSDIAKSAKPLLPPLVIPSIQLQKGDASPPVSQSPQSLNLPTSQPSQHSPRKNALLKWKQIAQDVSRTQSVSRHLMPGSLSPRFKRRGSEAFEESSRLGLGSENSLLVQRHRRRRGSCPAISWSGGDLFQEKLKTEEMKRQDEWTKQMEELKGCRYLRLPSSIDEHEEVGQDNTAERSGT